MLEGVIMQSYEQDIRDLDNAVNEMQEFIKDTRKTTLPKPPKPGEVMICQYCGKPMYPKDFSKDEKIRKREFKWHLHNSCMIAMSNLADLKTHGLLAERRRNEKRR